MGQILIIDDEQNVREAIGKIVESMGHVPVEAINGREGIRKFRERPTEVVISDILMPEKEGLETIRELRSIAPSVKIIAISGGARLQGTDFLSVAEQLGADAVLRKPFKIDQLCDMINSCLGSTKARSSD